MPNAPRRFQLHPKPAHGGKRPATVQRCKKYRTKGWEQTRQRIIARDAMQCQICGDLCIGKGNAHVDHVIAVVNGGSDDDDNLRLACASCHNSRTTKDNKH